MLAFNSEIEITSETNGTWYLEQLLNKPKVSFRCTHLESLLAGLAEETSTGSIGEVVDMKALKDYREPLLNPEIIEHIKLARRHWPNSELMLVTNGFYLGRHPELPQTLINSDVRLEISQHGTHSSYLAAFQQVNQHVGRWRREYPELCIKIRKSHQGWMRQYNIVNGKPMPFNSDPEAAYGICMQRTCTQLVNHQLAKCPALAYWPKLEAKAGLESIPEWQRFRDYQTCPASASDDEVRAFLDSGAIPQCSLCPSKRIPFAHPDPLQRSRLL